MGESVLPNGHHAPHGVAHEEALEAGVLLLYTRYRICIIVYQCCETGAGGGEIILRFRSRNYLSYICILTAMMNKNSFLPLLVQIACVLTVIVGVHFKVAMPQH